MITLHLLATQPGGRPIDPDAPLVRIKLAQGVRLVKGGSVYLGGEILSVDADTADQWEASGWCESASDDDVPSAPSATPTDEVVVFEVSTPVVFRPGTVSIMNIPTVQGP